MKIEMKKKETRNIRNRFVFICIESNRFFFCCFSLLAFFSENIWIRIEQRQRVFRQYTKKEEKKKMENMNDNFEMESTTTATQISNRKARKILYCDNLTGKIGKYVTHSPPRCIRNSCHFFAIHLQCNEEAKNALKSKSRRKTERKRRGKM